MSDVRPSPCRSCGGGPVLPPSLDALAKAPLAWQVRDAAGADVEGGLFQVFDEARRFAEKFGYPRPVPVYPSS